MLVFRLHLQHHEKKQVIVMTDETQQYPIDGNCCPNCGTAKGGTVFCTECGTRLPEPALSAVTPVEASAAEPEAAPPEPAEEPAEVQPIPTGEVQPLPVTELQTPPTAAAEPQTDAPAESDKKAGGRAEKKAAGGAVSVIFSVISAILLIAFTLVFMVVCFLHTIADDVKFPSYYDLSGARINDFMESPVPVLLGGGLVVIPMVLIILLNLRRIRRAVLTFGISDVIIGALCIPLGIFAADILRLFPSALQDVLMAPSNVFTDLSYVFGAGWIVLGIFLISVYACINVLRRKKNA